MPSASSAVVDRALVSRVAGRGWTMALFVLGMLFETIALINVPGAARPPVGGASPSITGLGLALWLVTTLAWVAVFWRRSRPLLPVVAGIVLLVIGTSYVLFLVGVLHAIRRWPERLRPIAAVTVTGVAFFVLREVVTPWGSALGWLLAGSVDGFDDTAANTVSIVIALASLGVVAGMVAYSRARGDRDANRDRADRERLRAEALGEQVARQAERERLARDIHDALSHRLSAISLQAGAFEASASTDPVVGARARTLREQAHASLEDLRGLLGELRMERSDGTPPALGSMRSLGHLLREVRAGGTRVEAYVVIDGPAQASALLDTAVYRIVQESLTNAVKHAPGAPVAVHVEAAAASGVRIRVSNPLRAGVANSTGSGHGTIGIRERAEGLGGTAWIGASDGEFIVDVTLPWSERG